MQARRWLGSLGLALLLASPPALAADPADAVAAQALFERGRAAAQRGELRLACASFAESHRLDAGAGTLLNLASCEARQGKVASAWLHFQEAASLLRPGDDRIGYVQRQIQEMARRSPRLTLALAPSAPPGTRVARAGTELAPASLGTALPVDPGEIELSVTCEGHHPRRLRVPIAEGEHIVLHLEPGAPDGRPANQANSPGRGGLDAAPRNAQRDLGIGLVALGSIGVALGAASSVVVAKRQATAERHCPEHRCDAAGLRAAESGERWLGVNTVAWSVGGAALLAGVTLWLTAPTEQRELAVVTHGDGVTVRHVERF